MEIFVRGMVKTMVKAAVATTTTQEKKTYHKWTESEREMALHIAAEKQSDSIAAAFMSPTFPKTFGVGG